MIEVSHVNIEKAKSIGGWMSEVELTWLANQAQKCKRIVEFGSFHGRSTRALADNTTGIVYAVDPWNGDYVAEDNKNIESVNTYVMPQFIKNLKDHIDSGRVIPARTFSTEFNLDRKVDMVFIDGDHRYQSVIKDINRALELLRLNGIISGHDYGHSMWPGVKKAVDELLGEINLVELIWWKQI